MSDSISVTIEYEKVEINILGPDFIQVNLLEPVILAGPTAQEIGSLIAGADVKTTPVDNDSLGISDSVDGDILKKLTFANLWVWIKTKIATVSVTLKIYSETNNPVTAGATETIPVTHRNHSYTLTESCVFTAPTLPAAGVRDSHVIDIASETFATSWAASPAIRWATSDNLPPTLDTTAGTASTITLRSNAASTFWQGRDGGETVAP